MGVNPVILGSVRNAQDASGVPGIQVEAEPIAAGGASATAVTNANGDFSIGPLPAGDYRVGLRLDPAPAGGQLWRPRHPDVGERSATIPAALGQARVATILVEPLTSSVTGVVLRDTGALMAGAPVELHQANQDGTPGSVIGAPVATNAVGRYTFANVPPGTYVVRLSGPPAVIGGQPFEPVLADPDEGDRTIEVPDDVNERAEVAPILVEPQRHRIFGTVRTSPEGPGAPFAQVRVLDTRGNLLATLQTDRDGNYEFRAAAAGRFLIEAVQAGVRSIETVEVQSDSRRDVILRGAAIPGIPTTQDFAAFPVLTESVSLPQAPAPAGAPPSSVGQTVQAALRDALRWRPRPNDPRGFTAALTQSFDLREVEGHTEAVWVQRSYATQVQADLGAITGAQASVYSRAMVALDAALPLLDGLYTLDPAADPQDTETIRTIIRTELNELVAELGVEGGPRLSRVDDLLDLLLRRPLATGHGTVNGQLALLEDRFGLVQARVETVAEEEDVTNFRTLRDYVVDIDASWTANRRFFDPTSGAQPFLGTQLVLLSRSLSVVGESVEEVGFTLDSVFVGAAERLAIRLEFPVGGATLTDSRGRPLPVSARTPSILVGDLMSWVERVANEEGPQLLQDGGRDGATALTPVLDRLRTLVRAALVTTGTPSGLQSPNSVPAGYATQRVQRALAELAKYLDDTAHLADQIRR
jgi:hypothetical protein